MSKIEITMFQAGCGDSFLITIRNDVDINILVDCGSMQTYYSFIKPKLLYLKEQEQAIDFLILTHMHADHIAGALALFKDNIDHETSKIVNIKNVLYNGFRGLDLCNYKDELGNEYDEAIYKGIIAEGFARISKCNDSGDISKKQELLLSSYLLRGGYNWNNFDQFENGIITADNLPTINIGDSSYLTFLSPNVYFDRVEPFARTFRTSLAEGESHPHGDSAACVTNF